MSKIPGLTSALIAEAHALVRAHGVLVDRPGAGPGSLTDAGLRYSVADAATVEQRAPSVFEWAQSPALRSWASEQAGEPVEPSDGRNSVNVNLLDGDGERYELHTDSNAYTLVVFLNTLGPQEGGVLMLDGVPHRAEAGVGLLFPGTAPHEVTPLRGDVNRATLVLSWGRPGDAGHTKALNDHLYG